MNDFRSEWLSRYDHGNEILDSELDSEFNLVHGIGGFQKTPETPSSSAQRQMTPAGSSDS